MKATDVLGIGGQSSGPSIFRTRGRPPSQRGLQPGWLPASTRAPSRPLPEQEARPRWPNQLQQSPARVLGLVIRLAWRTHAQQQRNAQTPADPSPFSITHRVLPAQCLSPCEISHRAKPTRSTTRRSHPAPMCHTTGDDPAPASIILRMLRGVLIMPSSELRTPRRDPAVTLQSARRARLLTVTRFCESSGDGKSAG